MFSLRKTHWDAFSAFYYSIFFKVSYHIWLWHPFAFLPWGFCIINVWGEALLSFESFDNNKKWKTFGIVLAFVFVIKCNVDEIFLESMTNLNWYCPIWYASWTCSRPNLRKQNLLKLPCSQSIQRWRVIPRNFYISSNFYFIANLTFLLAAVLLVLSKMTLYFCFWMFGRLAWESQLPDLQIRHWRYIFDQSVWGS